MVKEAKKEKKKNPYLPVIGVVLAFTVGVIAFFASEVLLDPIIGLYEDFSDQTFAERIEAVPGSEEEDQAKLYLQGALGVVIWLLVYAVLMFILSAAIGEDPEAEERLVKPRLGDKKATKKYFKEQDKLEDRRARQAAEKKRRERR